MSQPLILVAGPCAAETREQMLTIASELLSLQPQLQQAVEQPLQFVFRAGIWKPRTSPHSFQGVGDTGLECLQAVQRKGLSVATEAGTAIQAQKAVEAGVDIVWIGSRTCANPLQVQEIVSALRDNGGTLKAVAVKNPMHEDVGLWQGNIERMMSLGVPVWAVHRGCNHRSCWRMAYELRRSYPDVPLLIDPSHMSGMAQRVSVLSRKAAELGYDGWMIETHNMPEKAMSDAQQQILPRELCRCIVQPKEPDTLSWLRAEIDEVDEELWQTVLKRMEVSRRIGEYKRQTGMEVVQPTRFDFILRQRLEWAKEKGLSDNTINVMMNALHEESIRQQQ